MVVAHNMNNSTLRSILTSEKLTRPTIMSWHRNLRISLRSEKKLAYLEQPLIPTPLKKTLENYKAYDMLQELKTMFEEQTKHEPFEIVKRSTLVSKRMDYEQFVQNYNMHNMGKTIVELHAMLKLTEKGIPKKAATLVVLSIRGGKI
ncbi:hypothetical protein Tco_0686365 [Tanacetum coccineum]